MTQTSTASQRVPDPCVLVIFGASGDLTRRKLIPAIWHLREQGRLPDAFALVGVARRTWDDDDFRQQMREGLAEFVGAVDESVLDAFLAKIHYVSGDPADPATYTALRERFESLDRDYGTGGNRCFYCSVPPQIYLGIVEQMGKAGLNRQHQDGQGWCRIIVEKPFGHDFESAHGLNEALHDVFAEEQIYRIDHYLGKEVVQGILAFRFANTIFEPIWNQRYIDNIQITAAETVGVEDRTAFYDGAGAIRDMIQSHLFQILTFVAMEPPTLYSAAHVRSEKIKVIDALRIPQDDRLEEYCALGQYGPEGDQPGYAELEGVAPGSTTETYAALALFMDNWRWAGTPFFLRSGKRLARKSTEVVISFRPPAANLFRKLPGIDGGNGLIPNRIVMEIAPRESIRVRFESKVPGLEFKLDSLEMDSDFHERFKVEEVEAYGPLIIDAMRGDQTLFKHRYEVEGAWAAVMPFLDERSAGLRAGIRGNYAPGSWGPASSDALVARHGAAWNNENAAQPH